MRKTLVDTNVLLRYLIDDDEEQGVISEAVIEGGAWTTAEVLTEVCWVLGSVYNESRDGIWAGLCEIAGRVDIYPKSIVLEAIDIYKDTTLDFVDCMIAAYSKVTQEKVFTFDRKLNNKMLSDKGIICG